jgi:phage repressor protein C with HTH and peptisase S24 domain
MKVPVKGKSMEPFLKEGDIVEVVPKKFYFFGDVLLFFNFFGKVWCHRFIGISFKDGNIYFHLKGDNSDKKEAVPKSNIIGKVISITRNGSLLKIKRTKNFYLWIKSLWRILKVKLES